MKKILSAVLLGTFVLASFPAHAQNGLVGLAELGRQVVKTAAQEAQKNQRALRSIPQNASTRMTFSWSEPATQINRGGDVLAEGREYTENSCSAILCSYEEENGLGTVYVAVNAACVKEAIKGNRGSVMLNVFLGQFGFEPDPSPAIRGDALSYETEILRHTFKNILHYRKVTDPENSNKTIGAPIYFLYMPITSGQQQLKNGLKALFPNRRSFITAERAARALASKNTPSFAGHFDANDDF